MQSASENTDAATVVSTGPAERREHASANARSIGGLAAAQAEIEETLEEAEPPLLPQEPLAPGDIALLEVPEKLQQAIDIRICLWEELLKLEQQRHRLAQEKLTVTTRTEYSRQVAQLRNIPRAEDIYTTLERLHCEHRRLADPMARLARGAASDKLVNDPVASERYLQSLSMGMEQGKILMTRARLDDVVPRATATLVEAEPLVQLCARHDCDATGLVAWTFFARGLEQRIAEFERQAEEHRKRVEEYHDRQRSGGLIGRICRIGSATAESVPNVDPDEQRRHRAAMRELEAVEPNLVERFWSLYEDVAWLYGSDKLSSADSLVARAFLRYGLVAQHPSLIAPEKLEYVLDDCRNNVYEWNNTLRATHIVYADEHLQAVAHRLTTPGPDEDVEIAGRTSRMYKADRIWRQLVGGNIKIELHRQRLTNLRQDVQRLHNRVESLTERRNKLLKSPNRRFDVEAAKRLLAELRPRLARKQRMLDILETKHIPRQIDIVRDAGRRMKSTRGVLTIEDIVRREGRFIRRLARLASRLKTPYPHFVLRDRLQPGEPNCHDRESVQRAVQSVENADRHIFHQTIIPARKIERQLTVRVSPAVLIVPACGTTGISIIPRRESESGKVMVPLFGQRRDELDDIVVRILADFRWDCSVEDAGTDWMSADALCADYANVRWSFRHRNPDVQKRSGINRKQRDRQNWRNHYTLYIESAEDGGRKLFFKCLDIYEVVLRYVGLPEGVDRLHRT